MDGHATYQFPRHGKGARIPVLQDLDVYSFGQIAIAMWAGEFAAVGVGGIVEVTERYRTHVGRR